MGYWNNPQNYAGEKATLNEWGNYTLIDSVRDEILPWVDHHWYQYPPMNPLWYGLLGFVITVTGFLSISGNLIVVWVFMNTKSLRSPANLLVVNLAVSDFLMMLTNFPPMVYNCFHSTWMFSGFLCELYGFTGNLFGCISIYSMVWITIDRYNVIVKGVSAEPLTTSGALMRILAVWTVALAWTILPLFGWNRYVPEGNMTACGTDYLSGDFYSNLYLYIYGSFVYLLPLTLIIFYYSQIISSVAAHEKQMREQAKKMGIKSLRNEESQKMSAECRLAKVALTTVSLWFMAWTPYCVINFLGIFNKSAINPLLTIWGSVFAKANAVYNPIVYAISHPKYRAALQKKLPCLACSAESDNNSKSADNSSTASSATSAEKTETA